MHRYDIILAHYGVSILCLKCVEGFDIPVPPPVAVSILCLRCKIQTPRGVGWSLIEMFQFSV